MCFGSRKKEEADATRSRELDKIIKADEKRMAKEVKLLLLGEATSYSPPPPYNANWPFIAGAGESGKSTVLKQMKLIYATGFSKTEKLEWKPVVFNNIIQSFRMIHDAMTEFSIPFENPESEVRSVLRRLLLLVASFTT